MIPMIDTAVLPGLGAAVLGVHPALLVAGLAVVVGIAWLVRGTTEELRRQAARDFEARAIRLESTKPDTPLAA